MSEVYEEKERIEQKRRQRQENKKILKPHVLAYQEKISSLKGKEMMFQQRNKKKKKSSTLSDFILNHYEETRPSKYVKRMRRNFYFFARRVMLIAFPSIELTVYGSTATRLDDPDSDMDVGISKLVDEKEKCFDDDPHEGLRMLYELFLVVTLIAPTFEVIFLSNAKVPLLTINDHLSGLSLDVSCKPATLKLNMFNEYTAIDDRVLPLLKVVKSWAKHKQICNAYANFMNSFGYCCMVIAFLQHKSILPNLQSPETGDLIPASKYLISNSLATTNTSSVGDLLLEFFDFYVNHFDASTTRISILHGGFKEKEAHLFKQDKLSDNTLVCEDPFEPLVNFSRHVNKVTFAVIQKAFINAHTQLKNNHFLF